MKTCIAVGCTSGYPSNPEKLTFFNVPKNKSAAKLWQVACKRKDIELKPSHVFCENHFLETDIERVKQFKDAEGSVVATAPLLKPRLRPGAIPCLFAWVEDPVGYKEGILKNLTEPILKVSHVDQADESVRIAVATDAETDNCLFEDLKCNTKLHIPASWVQHTIKCGNASSIVYNKTVGKLVDGKVKPVCFKEFTIYEDMSFELKAVGELVNPTVLGFETNTISSLDMIEDALKLFDTLVVCSACKIDNNNSEFCSAAHKIGQDTWRHNNCPILIPNAATCDYCKKLYYVFDKKKKRSEDSGTSKTKRIRTDQIPWESIKLVQQLPKEKCYIKSELNRQCAQVEKLKEEITNLQGKLGSITAEELENKLKKVPVHQQHVVKKFFASAGKSSPKGRRYSEDWVILCLLMFMRSPKSYDFIRSNEILPLPCIRTVRRYLSTINTRCGFDENFFQLFQTSLAAKPENCKHGIILIDEMSTRESFQIKSTNLTYVGLINFVDIDGKQATTFEDKANHGLVIMYQPLDDVHAAQPIAVFASKRPVSGKLLAQLIVKAIVLVEKCGAKIHAVVSDGAAPNRSFWTEVGVSGKKEMLKSYFEHPIDPNRKVFVYSDTPHLIKTIRNRIFSHDIQMHPDQPVISWKHFQQLYDIDRKMPFRLCPKLSSQHVYLNNSTKMRVRLAVQVFSRSVANGLLFYKHYHEELQNTEATIEFCLWINKLFDSLNRRNPSEGLKPGSSDMLVIEDSLKKLDKWEELVKQNLISSDEFLTKQTAEGLRVTLRSMLDMTEELIKKFNFQSVLSGNVNQDALEVCYIKSNWYQKIYKEKFTIKSELVIGDDGL